MEGVSIVPTGLLESLISKVENLHEMVRKMDQERKEGTATYLTTTQTCKYLNKSRTWVMANKHNPGCSKRAGTLLFKRTDIDEYINSDYFEK